MNEPLVSIIVPTYGSDLNYLFQTLNSVLNQTYKNIEVVVVDDCSPNIEVDSISNRYNYDNRIKILKLHYNSGGGGARNLGLSNSNGEYIAFCDSDDVWPHDKLEKQIYFMISQGIKLSHSDKINFKPGYFNLVSTAPLINLKHFLTYTDLYCSSVCIKKSIIKNSKFGEMKMRHPFKMWCCLLEEVEHSVRCRDTFFYYRVRKDSVSSNKWKKLLYTFLAYCFYSPNMIIGFTYFIKRSFRPSSR